jgi:hypothetical protein
MIAISLWSFYYLKGKAEIPEIGDFHQQHFKMLAVLILLSVAWVYLISFHLPPVPATVPYKGTGVVVNNGAFVDSRLLHFGFCLMLPQLNFTIEKCEECLKTEYCLKVTGKNVVKEESADMKKEISDEFVLIDIDIEKVKEVYSKLKLCPECPDEQWSVSVYRKGVLKSGDAFNSLM